MCLADFSRLLRFGVVSCVGDKASPVPPAPLGLLLSLFETRLLMFSVIIHMLYPHSAELKTSLCSKCLKTEIEFKMSSET